MNPNVDKCEEKEGIVPSLENNEELVVDSQPVPMDGPVELSQVEVSVVSEMAALSVESQSEENVFPDTTSLDLTQNSAAIGFEKRGVTLSLLRAIRDEALRRDATKVRVATQLCCYPLLTYLFDWSILNAL